MQLAFELGAQPATPIDRQRGKTKIHGIESKSILHKATGRLDSYDYTMNPYRGCQFGCSYCYAAFFQPEPDRIADWGEWVDVKENAVALLRKDKRALGAKIYLGSATDAYQPIEMQLGLTRSLLDYMSTLMIQPRVVIQTRSPIVARDIDILKRFENIRVNLSITTDNEETRKAFEPKTASIARRLETAEKLIEAGISVGICVSPMLPIENPTEFGRKLRDLGATYYTASPFHKGSSSFAAGTRSKALQIAREMNWGGPEYIETLIQLRQALPELETKGLTFSPC